MRRLAILVLIAFLHHRAASEFQSEEVDDEIASQYDLFVLEGRQLKLTVHDRTNQKLYYPRWYHNGKLLRSKRCHVTRDKVVCPAVTRLDAGVYELWATDQNEHRYPVLSAKVHVTKVAVEPHDTSPERYDVEDVEPIAPTRYRQSHDCFCSGMSVPCRLAPNLYRSKHTFNLSSAEMVDHRILPTDTVQERCAAIPADVWGGNLITAYGGYLRFPVTDECYMERAKPCVILVDKSGLTIGHFLPARHDRRPLSVLMTESSWRVLATPDEVEGTEQPESGTQPTDKFTFMSVLSNIRTLYIRGRYRTTHEDTVLSIDQASPYDTGLGKVSTVEECYCHRGYAGLSCERCEEGYTPIFGLVSKNGVCVTDADVWKMAKRKYNI